ncbi:MAG: hypothetical protein ACK6BG_09485 [Cyanobacteriota bacterium]|jgi:hypothetical protein
MTLNLIAIIEQVLGENRSDLSMEFQARDPQLRRLLLQRVAVTEGKQRGDQVLVLKAVADRTTRMAFMPVSPLQKSLTALQPAIRHLLCLVDRAAGVADCRLPSLRNHFALAGGLR